MESLDRGRKLLDVGHHRVAGRVQDGRNLVLVQAFQAPAVHVNKLEARRTKVKTTTTDVCLSAACKHPLLHSGETVYYCCNGAACGSGQNQQKGSGIQEGGHTFPLRPLELRQRLLAPKQKQLVQPRGLEGSKWKEPSTQASQRSPPTCFCRHDHAAQSSSANTHAGLIRCRRPEEPPCRDTCRSPGGTPPQRRRRGCSCTGRTRGSRSVPQRSGRTVGRRLQACSCKHSVRPNKPAVRAHVRDRRRFPLTCTGPSGCRSRVWRRL